MTANHRMIMFTDCSWRSFNSLHFLAMTSLHFPSIFRPTSVTPPQSLSPRPDTHSPTLNLTNHTLPPQNLPWILATRTSTVIITSTRTLVDVKVSQLYYCIQLFDLLTLWPFNLVECCARALWQQTWATFQRWKTRVESKQNTRRTSPPWKPKSKRNVWTEFSTHSVIVFASICFFMVRNFILLVKFHFHSSRYAFLSVFVPTKSAWSPNWETGKWSVESRFSLSLFGH